MKSREHDTVKEIDLAAANGIVSAVIDDESTVKITEGSYQHWMEIELDRSYVAEVCCED